MKPLIEFRGFYIYYSTKMWIQKKPNGKYQYFERYKDFSGKVRTCSIVLDKCSPRAKKQAQRALAARIDSRRSKPEESVTLDELKEAYVKWKYANYKEQTGLSTERKLDIIIDKLGKDMKVSEITSAYYKEVMSEKPTTYNERLKFFKAMMRWGYQNELVKDISVIDRIPKLKDAPVRIKVKDKYLERDELDKLINAMKGKWKLLSQFLVLSGMRIGEAMDLEKKDIDMEERTITIDSTFSLVIRKSTSTKTDTSNRVIYIQDELIKVINDVNKLFPRGKYFFGGGSRIEYDSYRKYLRENSEKAIGRKVTPHIFRHTHTALLAEAGIPLEQISRRLGHSDSNITKEVYMHITEKAKENENLRIKSLKLL